LFKAIKCLLLYSSNIKHIINIQWVVQLNSGNLNKNIVIASNTYQKVILNYNTAMELIIDNKYLN